MLFPSESLPQRWETDLDAHTRQVTFQQSGAIVGPNPFVPELGGEWGKNNVVPSPERESRVPWSVLRSQARVQTVETAAYRHARALDALDSMPRRTRRERIARVPVADIVRRMPRMTDAESARALLEVLRLTGE